jgi:hypothetical protein
MHVGKTILIIPQVFISLDAVRPLLSPMNNISIDEFTKENCGISQGHLIALCVVNLVILEFILVGFVISNSCFGYYATACEV